jgi:hypothetical protein
MEGPTMANKDDQILAMLSDIQTYLGNLDTRLRKIEEDVQWLRTDMGTLGGWVREIKDRH